MNLIKKITIITIIFLSIDTSLNAGTPHFLDFKYILNQSDAEKVQTYLKEKLNDGIKNLQSREKAIQEEEKRLSNRKRLFLQKNIKKVTNLRNKGNALQKENNLLDNIAKHRSKARTSF